jgi:hypothetical protein
MLAPDKTGLVWIDDLTGGLNTTDPPQSIGDTQCQTAENIEWTDTRLAQRRQGGVNSIGTEVWGTGASLLGIFRHTPTSNETAAELWAVDNSNPQVLGRMAAGNNWAAVTVDDAIVDGKYADAASFNSKFFLAYDSAVDRMHVAVGATLRRLGLPKASVPTVANQGAGAYAAVQRWYKVVFFNETAAGTTGYIFSPASDAVSFTPSGAGASARVTRPTAPGEHETAWAVLGSPDNVNFYWLASAFLATTTYDDTAAPSSYATAPPVPGFPNDLDYFTTPPSPRYLLVDGARVLMLGSWETAAYTSRVWFTPILRTSGFGGLITDDSERVPSSNYLDLDPSDGGGLTGGAMFNGAAYAFKLSRIYKLLATGNVTKPYTRVIVSRTVGAIAHRTIVVGDDDAGNQCLYFLSRRGPYRLGPYGLEYLGRDIEATWKTVNYTPSGVQTFGVYHEKKGQVWWWVATNAAVTPTLLLKLSVKYAKRADDGIVRGGWSTDTGDVADAICAVAFANTLGAAMSLDLKPYVAQLRKSGDADGPLIKYDADATFTDRGSNGTTYVGKIRTKAFPPGGPAQRGGVQKAFVIGKPASGSARTLNVTAARNFDTADAKAGTVALTVGTGTNTRVQAPCENIEHIDADFIDLQLDDNGQGTATWTVDAIGVRIRKEGPA